MPVVDQSMLLQQAYTPGDEPAVQAAKLQQLWIWLQAYQEHVSQAVGGHQVLPSQHQDLAGAQDIQQGANAAAVWAIPVVAPAHGKISCEARSSSQHNGGPCSLQRQRALQGPSSGVVEERQPQDDQLHTSMSEPQQHQPAHLRQLLGTDSTDDPAAADMQQPADQGQHSLQQAGAMLPPPPAQQQVGHKELLARLLLPRQGLRGPAAAGAGTGAGAASIHAEHKQQQQQAPGQGRQRRLQQNKNSLQGVHGGENAAAAAQQQLQQLGIGWGQQHNEESPGPLEQQQMLRMRAQYLYDAQSQAPGAAAAPAAVNVQRPGLTLHQQLFSPRTATHAPAVCAGSNNADPAGSSLQQSPSPIAAPTPAAPQQQQLQGQGQQMDAEAEAEQPDEIEVTPLLPCGVTNKVGTAAAAAAAHAAIAQQQHWGSGVPTAAGAAAGSCPLLPPTAATPDALADQPAAAAAGAAAAACASDVETPAAVHTELVAVAGSYRAAAAAAAGLAAALFHTPGPGALADRPPRDVSVEAPGEAVQAGLQALDPVDCVAQPEETRGETPATQLQHLSASLGPTPPSQQQAAGVTPPMASAAAAEAATQAAAVGDIDCIAGSSPVDETQPPPEQQQEQHGTGVLDTAAQVKPPSQVPAAAASNRGSALKTTPCGGSGGTRKSAGAAALMLPPPPVPMLAAGVKSPAVGPSLQAGAGSGLGPRSGSPAWQQQQQRPKRPGPSPLNPALRRQGSDAAAAAAAAAGGNAAGAIKPKRDAEPGGIGHTAAVFNNTTGRTSFELRKVPQQLQSRLRELHLGAPVMHVTACIGYAVAVLQSAAGSGMHQLLLLEVAQQQQQQHEATPFQDKVPQQQQQLQPPAVVVSAEYTSAFVRPAQQLAAHRTDVSPQRQGCVKPDLLRTGLLLLLPQAPTAAESAQQSGPLLVVASGLQLQSEAPRSAAATAAVTPADTSMCPKLAALQKGGGSSAKRKLPGAGGHTSPHTGACDSSHTVNVYQLKHSNSSTQLAACQAGQQASTGAELVQCLPVRQAVRCLAACEQPGLLAAAGAGGYACVWPLQASQHAEAISAAGGNAGRGQFPVADASAVIELPAACYKGVVFPDISELCFIVQGTHTTSTSGQDSQPVGGLSSGLKQQPASHRVLLVGASSQGSIAVWDVRRRQQVIAVHCPDLRLSSLMAPAPYAAEATLAAAMRQQAAAGSGAAGAAPCTQQAGVGACESVVCLATVRSVDSNTSTGQKQQQGLAQLRAVVLHSSGELQLGVPLLVAGHQGGISAATLMGTTAAAATAAGTLKVWDIFSGKRHIVLKPAPAAVNSSVVGALAVICVPDGGLGAGPAWMGADREGCANQQTGQLKLVLAGSAAGVMTAVVF